MALSSAAALLTPPGSGPQSLQQRLIQRFESLKTARASYVSDWQSVATQFAPNRGRWNNKREESRGSEYQSVIDSTPLRARRILAAGMMSGMTSPARPWFKLQAANEDTNELPHVRRWLDDTTQSMRKVFATTNTYHSLHSMYEEIGTFGTAGMFLLPDSERIIHSFVQTAGEYAIALDDQLKVNTVCREMMMTVGQMATKFGLDKCSQTVRTLHERGHLDEQIDVVHCVEPRENRDVNSPLTENMPWHSVYFEPGAPTQKEPLRSSGFELFPCVFPRWMTVGATAYGTGPAIEALGDARQLQHQQLRKGQLIDIHADPELIAPAALKGHMKNRKPGKITYTDNTEQKVERLFNASFDPQLLLEDIQDVRTRINETFYADLFLMMISDPRATPATAREVAERHEEKLVMLGPVIERLQDEMLRPVIDLTFDHMLTAGLLDDVPDELIEEGELTVTYTSVLAQAQQMVGIGSMERFSRYVAEMSTLHPQAIDKMNVDEAIAKYGELVGVDPDVIRTDEEVAAVREQRQQQEQLAQASELANQTSETARNLAQAPTGPDESNALQDVLSGLQGYTPQ